MPVDDSETNTQNVLTELLLQHLLAHILQPAVRSVVVAQGVAVALLVALQHRAQALRGAQCAAGCVDVTGDQRARCTLVSDKFARKSCLVE